MSSISQRTSLLAETGCTNDHRASRSLQNLRLGLQLPLNSANGVARSRSGSPSFARTISTDTSGSKCWSQAVTVSDRNMLNDPCGTPVRLRTVSPGQLLGHFGESIRKSPDEVSGNTRQWRFSKSQESANLDIFLSHRWLASGGRKYMALVFYFGWRPGMIIGSLASLVTFVYCARMGVYTKNTSLTNTLTFVPEHPTHFSLVCMLIGEVMMLLTVLVSPWLFSRTRLFIDYLCIDQSSDEVRRQGAMMLTDYLYKAKLLLVIWDREYFTRLWTTFEMAAFASIHEENEDAAVDILPLTMASIYVPVQILAWGAFFSIQIGWIYFPATSSSIIGIIALSVPSLLPTYFAIVYFVRSYAGDRAALLEQLRTFDVQRASCREVADRTMILDSIGTWYGSLETFNEVLSNIVAVECGGLFSNLPTYKTTLFLSSGAIFFFMDVSPIAFDGPIDTKLTWGIVAIDWILFATPMHIATLFLVGDYYAQRKPHWSSVRYIIVTSCLSALQIMTYIASVLIPTWLSPHCGVIPILCVSLLHGIVAVLTFGVARKQQQERGQSEYTLVSPTPRFLHGGEYKF